LFLPGCIFLRQKKEHCLKKYNLEERSKTIVLKKYNLEEIRKSIVLKNTTWKKEERALS
jgi:hypothetical protein